ncbi:hypothetical protein AB833_03115 [Chromatiales bacterium (ex Bugula neritina AB1)]|nr:hypothetical protein AB833_03115 [Chromatiales bacterium (ex Bugula neritina AB1)]
MLRGGSWINNGRNCRSAYRNHNEPDRRNNNVGFRLSRELAQQNLCYCERATTDRFDRSLSLRMNSYVPQVIVKTSSPCHALATQTSTTQAPDPESEGRRPVWMHPSPEKRSRPAQLPVHRNLLWQKAVNRRVLVGIGAEAHPNARGGPFNSFIA